MFLGFCIYLSMLNEHVVWSVCLVNYHLSKAVVSGNGGSSSIMVKPFADKDVPLMGA